MRQLKLADLMSLQVSTAAVKAFTHWILLFVAELFEVVDQMSPSSEQCYLN